jgi:hypothetical protein
MADRDTDLIEKLVGHRLEAIATELKQLNQILESFKSATQREIQGIDAQMASLQRAQLAIPAAIPRYLSGRWPLRDGDGYGIVSAQPPLIADKATAELPDADNKTGDIRSTDER